MMFRRRRTNETAVDSKRSAPVPQPPSSPSMDHPPSPLANPMGLWYKKPQAHTPLGDKGINNNNNNSHSHSNNNNTTPYHRDHRRSVGHTGEVTAPPPPSSSTTQRRDHRRSIGHAPEINQFHVPEYKTTTNIPSNPVSTPRMNRRISGGGVGDTTTESLDLFQIFSKGTVDWNAARTKMEQDPPSMRQKQNVLILGHRTQAYPLHLAVCTPAPMPILDKLLAGFSSAIQLPDDYNGRLPLHWACIASASPAVLQKLIGLHPAACKTADKMYGRLPLHYIAMHANSLTQVSILLEGGDTRGLSTKDKQSKTPLDLAQESSNPLKLDILSLLQKGKHTNNGGGGSSSSGTSRRRGSKKDEDISKRISSGGGGGGAIYDEWETPLNVKVSKPPGPEFHEYQVPDYSFGGGGALPPEYKLPVQASPAFRNSAKTTATSSSSKGAVAKAPTTGGFFLDKTLRRNGMERTDSSVGSAEDPGPRTNTKADFPAAPVMDRSETWGMESPRDGDVRRSLQDKLVKNAFDFSNDSLPLDPSSQPMLPSKTTRQKQQRRPSGNKIVPQSVPPKHPTRKLKPPPPGSSPQQSNDILDSRMDPRSVLPPSATSRPTTTTTTTTTKALKRQSDPSPPHTQIAPSPQFHQTKRRSEPLAPDSGAGAPPRHPTKAEREYFRRHVEKMEGYSQQHEQQQQQQPHHQQQKSPGVTYESRPPSSSSRKEEEMKGRDLVNGMNSTIRGLSEKIAQQERDLQEKNAQLADLDMQISQMGAEEVQLVQHYDMAQAQARQNQDAVRQKQSRILSLAQQIQQLQAELRAEEMDMESIERNLPVYQENANRAESKLKAHRDEQGSLGAVRQALDDEKACITRELDNCTCELKSLEAIQNLAMRGDDL